MNQGAILRQLRAIAGKCAFLACQGRFAGKATVPAIAPLSGRGFALIARLKKIMIFLQ